MRAQEKLRTGSLKCKLKLYLLVISNLTSQRSNASGGLNREQTLVAKYKTIVFIKLFKGTFLMHLN